MSKPAFTPGPWSFINNSWWGESSVYGPDDCLIAEVTIRDSWTEENQTDLELIKEANARLIAAAPDMYEALLAAKVVIEMMERPEGMGGRVNAALDKRLAQIDAAIAKAEGRATA